MLCLTFQVILCNKGDIDAVFKLIPPNTQFGPQFSFTPEQGIVIPGGYQAIQVKSILFFFCNILNILNIKWNLKMFLFTCLV